MPRAPADGAAAGSAQAVAGRPPPPRVPGAVIAPGTTRGHVAAASTFGQTFDSRLYEPRRLYRVDRVSVGAHEFHTTGKPIKDRANVSWHCPNLSICAGVGEKLAIPKRCAQTARGSVLVRVRPPRRIMEVDRLQRSRPSRAVGAGHPIKPISFSREADACNWKNDRPAGVTHGFQIIEYKVDPPSRVFACNLFTNDNWRAFDFDKVKESGP